MKTKYFTLRLSRNFIKEGGSVLLKIFENLLNTTFPDYTKNKNKPNNKNGHSKTEMFIHKINSNFVIKPSKWIHTFQSPTTGAQYERNEMMRRKLEMFS